MRSVVNCHREVGRKRDNVISSCIHDDSRFSAQAMSMIELICLFMITSVFKNVFCVSPIHGYLR